MWTAAVHCVADCIIQRVIPQPTEWQHIGKHVTDGIWSVLYDGTGAGEITLPLMIQSVPGLLSSLTSREAR